MREARQGQREPKPPSVTKEKCAWRRGKRERERETRVAKPKGELDIYIGDSRLYTERRTLSNIPLNEGLRKGWKNWWREKILENPLLDSRSPSFLTRTRAELCPGCSRSRGGFNRA